MAIAVEMRYFTLAWEVKNFSSFLSNEGSVLCSPYFKAMTSEGSVWRSLRLHNKDQHIQFKQFDEKFKLVQRNPSFEGFKVSIILSSRGEIPVENDTIPKHAITGSNSWWKGALLHDDTLTVCCKMLTKVESAEMRIRTIIYKDNFIWDIRNFNRLSSYIDKCIEKKNLLFFLHLERNDIEKVHTFQFEAIPNSGGCLSFVHTYIEPSREFRHWKSYFNSSFSSDAKQRWDIIVSKDTSDFQLHLNSVYAVHRELSGIPSSPGCARKRSATEVVTGSSGALNSDLLHLYREGTLSDATLNTEGKSFSAHRSILAARSPVFRAMFEKDKMSEGRSGVVDIDDVDSATMDRMLVFLYGESLYDLQLEEAVALYYAADKYAIQTLKQKCADVLKANLSVANVCDVLVLADKHTDQDLMTCTLNFIQDHKEVITSPDWEKLEESNYRLTSKITKEILLKKWVN